MKHLIVMAAAALSLSGCVTPREVANPDDISLRRAVLQVAETLHEVRDTYAGKKKIGLGVQSATVVFNISSKATDTGEVKIEAAAGESVGFPLSGMFGRTLTNEGMRGNTITIVFAPAGAKATGKPPASSPSAKAADITDSIMSGRLTLEEGTRLIEQLRRTKR